MTRALDRNRKLTLMLCAGAGDSSGKDLCTFAYALAESDSVLVIDVFDFICAELAYFSASVCAYGTRRFLLSLLLDFLFAIHDMKPPVMIFLIFTQNGRSSSFDSSSNFGAADCVPENEGAE